MPPTSQSVYHRVRFWAEGDSVEDVVRSYARLSDEQRERLLEELSGKK